MELKDGEKIFLKPEDSDIRYSGEVLTVEPDGVTVKLPSVIREIKKNATVLIIMERPDYYNEWQATITEIKDRILKLKWQWVDRREFFRIDDIIPIGAKKISPEKKGPSRITFGESSYLPYPLSDKGIMEIPETGQSQQGLDSAILRLLLEINKKLDMLLEERGNSGEEEIRPQPVNISAGGIRFLTDEKVSKGDLMEIRMHLWTCPPLKIITYGEVVRVIEKNNKYEVAVSFKNSEEEVREAILRYTLQKQRELLKKQR
jgi:c-di-GMP-binding flagellar brake protein YcgR